MVKRVLWLAPLLVVANGLIGSVVAQVNPVLQIEGALEEPRMGPADAAKPDIDGVFALPLAEPGAQDQPQVDEAMTLRLMRIEQLLRAQQNLARSGTDTRALEERLQRIETALGDMRVGGVTEARPAATSLNDQEAADMRIRLTSLEDSIRRIQGQTEEILRLLMQAEETNQRVAADMEFRFQALEGKVIQRENQTSEEPLIIGRVAAPAPVTGETEVMPSAGPVVGEQLTELVPADQLVPLADPDKLYDRGLTSLRAGQYASARQDFQRILKDFPKHKRAGNAQYWLGETFYVERDYKQAAQAFLSGYTTYAESGKAPDSLLKLGISLLALEQKKAACDAFADLIVKFPSASEAVRQRASNEQKRAGCDL